MPIKRSINFGVFLHSEKLAANNTLAGATGNIGERLESSGFTPVTAGGLSRIEAREYTEGSDVVDRRNLLAFVFDNTFSISNSKHVQLLFNIEPLSPPPTTADSNFSDASEAASHSSTNAASAAAAAALYHHPDGAAGAPQRDSDPALAPFPSVTHPNLTESSSTAALGASQKLSFARARPPDAKALSTRRNTHSSTSGASVVPNGSSDDEEGSSKKRRHRGSGLSSFSSVNECDVVKSLDGRYVNGFLQKKRRKQFQGFARRYFTLDKQTGLLNYYLNNRSRSLRGVMPIKIAEVKAEQQTLQFTLNSGMEKWTLKASDQKTLAAWCAELREVRKASAQDESELEYEDEASSVRSPIDSAAAVRGSSLLRSATWEGSLPKPGQKLNEIPALEELRLSISRLQNPNRMSFEGIYLSIIKETLELVNKSSGGITPKLASKIAPPISRPTPSSRQSQATITPIEKSSMSFAKRLKSLLLQMRSRNFLILSSLGFLVGALFGLSHALAILIVLISAAGGDLAQFRSYTEGGSFAASDGESFAEVYGGANAGLHLDNGSKPSLASSGGASSGRSGGSEEDDEDEDFSDLSDEEEKESMGTVSYVPQKPIVKGSQLPDSKNEYFAAQRDAGLASSAAAAAMGIAGTAATGSVEIGVAAGETAETSHYPLPHSRIIRRNQVEAPIYQPPSLLALLKKAKNPSNMTAPIVTNEPLSAVESVAEMFEYADLLDAASKAAPSSNLRLSMVALFAVARCSGIRIKERALRKPFTPLLGETYELVREDLGFRFLAEKVVHKPEVVASQAESPLWTVHYTSRPHSKMWAKSIQLTDVGHFSVTFPDGESVSFMNPEMFIRNVIAGERYVEPTGTTTVEYSENPQVTALIEFKAGGMFSGRSEEVKITSGKIVYEGKWTESMYEGNRQVWAVKPMVENASKHYGWPVFAAQLNEITELEKNRLPPNDSRLRPDLRIYEQQKDVEYAEKVKLNLEQKQRERRKELELAGKQHEPFFFVKSNDSRGHYILRHGARNYWVQRQNQDWSSIPHYFKG